MLRDDYISKVSKEIYSDDEKIQLEELKQSKQLERFNASREKMSKDPHRPIYHFTSPECKLNDPNGLCYWNDRWHLFYQAYPPEDSRQHWGHAVSNDLITWQDLPYAIYPNPENACFSGSVLTEEDRAIAMYHGTTVGNMIALSNDPLLLNWEKLTDDAVILSPDRYSNIVQPYSVFDPCIWKEGDYYYSISGGSKPHYVKSRKTRMFFLFRSSNLTDWEYMHEFVDSDKLDIFSRIGDDGACPYFWPIGKDKYMLLCFSHMSGGQIIIGDYNKEKQKFIPTQLQRANFGKVNPGGFHAPSAAPQKDGSVVAIFNVNSSKETPVYRDVMSLPRQYSISSDNKLTVKPYGNIKSLHQNHSRIENMVVVPNKEVVLNNMSGNSIEINAKIEIQDSSMIEINVLRAEDKSEYTRICYYHKKGFHLNRFFPEEKEIESIIAIDTSHSTTHSDVEIRPVENAPVSLGDVTELDLRIFIDKSIVEVFVNDSICVGCRVYPASADSTGISIFSAGSDIIIKSMDVYQMKRVIK